MNVFRASIPVNPRFTLGDQYALSVLLTVLWTVIDAFAFPIKEDEEYTRKAFRAHYTCIAIVSTFPAYVLLKTVYLYLRYCRLKGELHKNDNEGKSKATRDMIKEQWKCEKVPKDHLKSFTKKMQVEFPFEDENAMTTHYVRKGTKEKE